eukprot:365910-Chlamydomonas_euryale.AAC.15
MVRSTPGVCHDRLCQQKWYGVAAVHIMKDIKTPGLQKSPQQASGDDPKPRAAHEPPNPAMGAVHVHMHGHAAALRREDLLEAARILNGSDFDGDGEGDYTLHVETGLENHQYDGIAWSLSFDGSHWSVPFLSGPADVPTCAMQVLATLTQVGGGKTGWLFDPDNMQLLGSRDVVEHTLSLLQQFSPLAWPLQSCVNVINPQTWQGKCAITIGQATSWKTAQRLGPPQLKVGAKPC